MGTDYHQDLAVLREVVRQSIDDIEGLTRRMLERVGERTGA